MKVKFLINKGMAMEYFSGIKVFGKEISYLTNFNILPRFSGNWKNDKKNGYGECEMKNGDRYFKLSIIHLSYKGNFKDNEFDGFGKYTSKNAIWFFDILRNFLIVMKVFGRKAKSMVMVF